MKKKLFCLSLTLILLMVQLFALAEPDLTLQDPSVRSGSLPGVYLQILEEHSAGIRAYQDYVLSITFAPVCRAVGLVDLTGDSEPELLFWDLIEDTEYGFHVGRLWIYTSGPDGVHCALTFHPEIDDLLYSRYYLAKDGLLTVHFSDCEMGWVLQLRPDKTGHYAADTVLISQEDFSGEGPDAYFRNGKKITAKKYKSLLTQIQAGEGALIGSLNVDEGGYGFACTLEEAMEALSSEEAAAPPQPADSASSDPADPSGALLPQLSFSPGSFTKGQKFAVYSAPSARSWRGANGKAAITSGSEIFVAGTSEGWILILYELNSGVNRVGYIDREKISGPCTAGAELSFSRIPAVLKESAVMTDDPVRQKSTVGKLKKGTAVTVLAEYQGWLYVETEVKGKTARGFISSSSLEY